MLYSIAILFGTLLALIPLATSTLGVDVSQATSVSSFQCLKSSGYSFAIVRVYQSNGKVDPNGATTISNAWAGGMSHVDGYIFPCYSCGNPAGQMDAAINSLAAAGLQHVPHEALNVSTTATSTAKSGTYGMLWIDVEGTQYWSTSQSSNVAFLQAMVNEGKARGISLGMYTSNSQWSPITGGSTAFSSLPLWYPHYDGNPSYSDWVPFGGWSSPAIKQYIGTTAICSASVDKNYY